MNVLYVKALHIIFVITWFSGLFYIVRLFVYHSEAETKSADVRDILVEQYKIMEKRLWYIITWPSAIITIVTGLMLAQLYGYWTMPWMYLKLGFVFALFLYQLKCHQLFSKLQKGENVWSSGKFRLWNEVATVLCIAIVFTVVLKSMIDWVWGIVGIVGVSVCLMIAVKWYKKIREKDE